MKQPIGKKAKSLTQQYADLKKLGDYLGANEVKNPSRAKVAKQRQGALVDQYRASIGGGQGKVVPTSRIVAPPKKDKVSPKMNPQQKRESFVKFGEGHVGTWNVSSKKK